MECRNNSKFDNLDLRTEKQWRKEYKKPLPDTGIQLWANQNCQLAPIYYLPEEVTDMGAEEIKAIKKKEAEKRAEKRKKREAEKKAEEKKWNEFYYEEGKAAAEAEAEKLSVWVNNACDSFLEFISKLPPKPCTNKSKIICLDTETTGLSERADEILQLSILSGAGEILFHSYIKPYNHLQWAEAEKINGITPEMVKAAPYPHEVLQEVKGIFESAEEIIIYNAPYDLKMLKRWSIEPRPNQKIYDVMLKFAEEMGEWNYNYNDFKWQKLTTCAEYFNYTDFKEKAHDSLEDTRATLYSYRQLKKIDSEIKEMEAAGSFTDLQKAVKKAKNTKALRRCYQWLEESYPLIMYLSRGVYALYEQQEQEEGIIWEAIHSFFADKKSEEEGNCAIYPGVFGETKETGALIVRSILDYVVVVYYDFEEAEVIAEKETLQKRYKPIS